MREEVQPIASRLAAADRSLQKERGGSFLFRSFKYFCGLVLLLFFLDVFLHLGATHRILLLAGLGAVLLTALGWACYVAYVRKNPLERVARILEERDPALGSKLINILQIRAQTEDATLSPLTRQLAQQAVEDYSGRLQQADLQRVARTAALKLAFRQAALAGLIFVGVLAAFFRISLLEILRFTDPHGDHPPYSFTRLEITEPIQDGAPIVYNQNMLVKVKHAGHRPGEVFLTFFDPQHPESPTTVPMFGKGELGFFQQIEGVKSDLVVFAHTRNHNAYSRKRLVSVLRTPRLDKAFVQISPPAYTGLQEKEKPYQFKNFRALAGSEVKFRLQSNRPMQGGTLEVMKSETDIQRLPLAKSGENEVSATLPVQDTARLRFSLVDIDRLTSQDPMEGSVTVTFDLAPDVQISQPTKDSFVSLDHPIVGEIMASDDYGLRTIRVHRALNQVYSAPKTISYDGVKTSAKETVRFDFQELGVQSGDVISFFAEAIDTAPTPNLSRSQTINLMLITEDEYNDFLRERSDISDIEGKYADLLNKFQDLIDEQRKIGEKIDELRARLAQADEKEKAAVQKELDALLARQSELNSKLNQMADTMEKFVRKNPVYDVESELQRMLAEKAREIRESTQANEQKTQDLARQSSGQTAPRPGTLDGFKQASDEQLKKLGAMEKEAQEQIAQTLDDMSALHELVKEFNQFEELYKMQEALANQARAYNTSKELGPDDQLALKQMAATEREVRQALEQLAEKLRQDAKAAEKQFPKAAQSASDLADKIEEKRLPPLAGEATGKMLNAEGEPSFQLAEKLRSEMEQLFGECKSQGSQMSNELDNYLKLQKGLNPGNSFRQMMLSRKFGFGSDKGSLGQGKGGLSGFAIMTAPGLDVLGNENRIEKGDARNAPPNPGKEGKSGSGKPGDDLKFDKPDVVKGMTPVNRKSDAVTAESFFEEYGDIIDKYFKSITK